MTKYRWGVPQGIGEWIAVAFLASFIYSSLQQLAKMLEDGRAAFDAFDSSLSDAGWGFLICMSLIPLFMLPAAIFNFLGHWLSSLCLLGWSVGQLLMNFSRVQGVMDGFSLWVGGLLLLILGCTGQIFFLFCRPIPPPFALKETPQSGNATVWLADLGKKSGDVVVDLAQISNWGMFLLNKHFKDNLPVALAENISQADAENLKARLEAKGATVEIRLTAPEK